ncbi:MAG TPA: polysaccharide deacetylase family protein [Burkholderiales bacterium]
MKPSRYGPFPYTPITRRPKLVWPNGARVALWVIPNIEFFPLDERMPDGPGGSGGLIPDVLTWATRDYGNRVGIWRLMEVMARHGVRGTAALNSEVCDAHPEIIDEAKRLGWEFMGHNQSNVRRLNKLAEGTEREVVRATLERIAAATGRKVAGWLGSGLQETWHTLDYLAEFGCKYVADWVNDDQPYVMDLGGRRLCSIPYSAEINDKVAVEYHHVSPEEFERMIRRQFEVLHREGERSGRVMAIALHPYIFGVPHRIDALDRALKFVASQSGVWLATGEEIVEQYLKQGGGK